MSLRIAPLKAIGLAFLVVLDVWLSVILVTAFASQHPVPIETSDWMPKKPRPNDGVVLRKPASMYAETLAHPVFFRSRQPYVPPPPPSPMARQKAVVASRPIVDPGFNVGGVIVDRDVRKAYLFSKGDPRGTWVSQGEDIFGWTVHSVNQNGATLRQQSRTIEVLLYPKH